MRVLILLLAIATTYAQNNNCSYIFDGENYGRMETLSTKGLPTNLVYNPINNELLFTLVDLETLLNDDVQTEMNQYIVRNGEAIKIDNVKGQAAAVDAKNKVVYIASDEGLNVLNGSSANYISNKNEDIVQLFKPSHKDELYAVIYPDNEVFVINLQKNEKKKIASIPCAYFLAVDENDNIFYECDSKYVKMLLNGFKEPIEFVGITKNSARAVTVDEHNGESRVILATNDGLYHLRPDNVIPRKLMGLEYAPSGITFDEDGFYISTNSVIYKYSKKLCQ